MTLPTYSAFEVQNDQMFFMLEAIDSDEFSLVRRTPAGDEEFSEFSAHRMADGHTLLAFPQHFTVATKGNLVAKTADREEIVNVQVFERLRRHYDRGLVLDDSKGAFFFCDSQPLHDPRDEWRCDTTAYGPKKYLAPEESHTPLISDVSRLRTYEPVISVNGIAHLIYLHLNDDEEIRDRAINGFEAPCAGVTLSEALRLIYEWAVVADPPFSNSEDIANDARDFLSAIGFYPGLVGNQVEMQVARYLRGDSDARRRPLSPEDNTDELRLWLKKRVAFGSLAGVLSLYPGSGDISAAAEIDLLAVENDYASSLFYFGVDPTDHALSDHERGIEAIDPTRQIGAREFMRRKVDLLLEKRDIALTLRDNPSADI
jgi:hypothetical protein